MSTEVRSNYESVKRKCNNLETFIVEMRPVLCV